MGPAEIAADLDHVYRLRDAGETARKIRAAGGQVMMEPMDVMDVGRMAIAADPGGAVFGIWQAGSHSGVQLANEPGSLTWNENIEPRLRRQQGLLPGGVRLRVRRHELGAASTTPRPTWAATRSAGSASWIRNFPPEVPANWATYFGVADADAAVARAEELGGSVVRPAWDTPYGRMAVLADNQGAVFAVVAAVLGGRARLSFGRGAQPDGVDDRDPAARTA